MSRQLNYYHENSAEINAKRRTKRKAMRKATALHSSLSKRKAISLPIKSTSSSLGISTPIKQTRLHARGIKQALASPLTEQDIKLKLSTIQASYTRTKEKATAFYFFKLNGLSARITASDNTSSITLWASEKDTRDGSQALRMARYRMDRKLKETRNLAKILLELRFKGRPKSIEEHIAFQGDEYASNVVVNRHKIRLLHKRDKRTRLEVDASKKDSVSGLKIPELEFMHRNTSYADALKYAKHVESIYTDKWNSDSQRAFNQSQVRFNQTMQETVKGLVDYVKRNERYKSGHTDLILQDKKLIIQVSKLIKELRMERRRK